MDYVGKYVDIDCAKKIVYFKRFSSARSAYSEIQDVFDGPQFVIEPVPISMLCLHHPPREMNGWEFVGKNQLKVATIYKAYTAAEQLTKDLINNS